MSVGHVARLLEAAGILTVIIAARTFRPRLEPMRLPRVLLTPFPMGRPLGAPGDGEVQREVVLAGLRLLETAVSNNTILEIPPPYRPRNLR